MYNKGYTEALKLWLWYNYQCELYDSTICTGSNEYEQYMPSSDKERKMINRNARENLNILYEKRKILEDNGMKITDGDWKNAKRHYNNRYTLAGLEKEYNYYFNTNNKTEQILFDEDLEKINNAVKFYPLGSYQMGEIARLGGLLQETGVDVVNEMNKLCFKYYVEG